MALGISPGSTNMPTSTFITEHRPLAAGDNSDVDERQQWIEAYARSLQHVAEASVGQFWTTEGERMILQVSNLVETFLAMTGTCMFPHTSSGNAGPHHRRRHLSKICMGYEKL